MNFFAVFAGCASLFIPVMYGVMGFITGIIGAALYNVVAKMTGGLEFQIADAPMQPY
jgi:hypothetical protein